MTGPHFLALDGGGSGCRAIICGPDGNEISRVAGGGANLTSDFEAAARNIRDTIMAACREAGLDEAAISASIAVLGVAGAEVGDSALRLSAQLPFAMSQVVSDQDITIAGVLGQNDGTLAQIGTGSFFVTQCDTRIRRAGGHGFILGDECSGGWLGREVLRATLRAYDGTAASSLLTNAIMAEFDDDPHKIVLFARDASAAAFAGYAPRLFSAAQDGDVIASAIINEAVHDLERIVAIIESEDAEAENTGPENSGPENRRKGATPPLFLCGGVGERFIPLVSENFRDRIAVPDGDGISGALIMARNLYETGQDHG